MRSKRSTEGYFQIDHRASPGTPMVKEGTVFEAPVLTCAHCHAQLFVNPGRTRDRAYCRKCDSYVCDGCEARRVASGYECHNMNAHFDRVQEAASRGRVTPGGIILP